jgi:hypothetical protein
MAMHTSDTTFSHMVRQNGFAHIPLCVEYETLQQAVDHFLYIAQSPHAYNDWIIQRAEHTEPDTGRIDRRGTQTAEGKQGDRKIFFHYDGHDVSHLLRTEKTAVFSTQDIRFFEHCTVLYDSLYAYAAAYAQELVASVGGKKGRTLRDFFPKDHHLGRNQAVLRFLAYMETREDESGIIGREHMDRSGLTFAVAESGPGLELQKPDSVYVADSPTEKTLIAFPGGKTQTLSQNTSRPIQATWHRVRAHEHRVNDAIIRWSVVFFLHPFGNISVPQTHR